MKYKDPDTGEIKQLYLPPTGDTLPIGSMMPFTSDSIPTNWLLCDGQAVSRTTYSELFSLIGTTYGTGDGSTTFNVPDMRSYVPVGKDSIDTNIDALGKKYGEKTHKLTIDETPNHTHSYGVSSTTGGQVQNQPGYGGEASFTQNVGATGGGQSHNNMQPSIATNYIIKAKNSVGLVGNVTNVYSESTQDSYSCEYINTKELWTNSNDELPFEEQTITFSSDDYDYIDIYYYIHISRTRKLKSMRMLKGCDFIISDQEGSNLYDRHFTRVSDTSYTIGLGNVYNTYGLTTPTSTSSNILIPFKIIGGHL